MIQTVVRNRSFNSSTSCLYVILLHLAAHAQILDVVQLRWFDLFISI